MISQKMIPLVNNSSVIRAMFEEGKKMAAEVGAENVYDFSIGNPNVPAPAEVKDALIDLLQNENPVKVHGYMNNAGFEETRDAIAKNLNRRFGTNFTQKNIIMTVGAGCALNMLLKTMVDPGDEIVVFAPYFVEYANYIRNYDGVTVTVSPNPDHGFMEEADREPRRLACFWQTQLSVQANTYRDFLSTARKEWAPR